MRTRTGVYQLSDHAELVAVLSDTAFERPLCLDPLPDCPHVLGVVFETEGGSPRYHAQFSYGGKRVRDLFGEPVADVLVGRVRTQVEEWQHNDRGRLGAGAGPQQQYGCDGGQAHSCAGQ
ncbi:MAG: hypothetical protein HY820_28710 [Acidobacteria bacterium]|nr:hypothetical protein [Acidobacteriota bacterium]